MSTERRAYVSIVKSINHSFTVACKTLPKRVNSPVYFRMHEESYLPSLAGHAYSDAPLVKSKDASIRPEILVQRLQCAKEDGLSHPTADNAKRDLHE